MTTLHLNQMLTFTQPGSYQMVSISPDQARRLVKKYHYQSHITFQNTRTLVEDVLGIHISMPRLTAERLTMLKPGDKVLLFKPKQGYRPERGSRLRLQDFDIQLIHYELMDQGAVDAFRMSA